jgi:hypothetical protein
LVPKTAKKEKIVKYIYEFDSNAPRESLAVAYARYSSTNQNEVSIQTQLYHIHEYVQNKKLSLCGAYTDEARTGKHDRRPGFQKMIADAKEKPPMEPYFIPSLPV